MNSSTHNNYQTPENLITELSIPFRMISGEETKSAEFLDFCNDQQIDLSLRDKGKALMLIEGIKNNKKFSELAAIFKDDLDQMAYCAVYAFSLNILTRNQTATFLEYRSLNKNFQNIEVIDLAADITDFALSHLTNLRKNELPKLKNLIKEMHNENRPFDACIFIATIPKEDTENMNIKGLLEFADSTGIILIYHEAITKQKAFDDKEIDFIPSKIHIGSPEIRNAATNARYNKHAKKIFPKLGKFTLDQISNSIKNDGRYLFVDFPSVESPKSFHQVKDTSPTYLGLHDELHRQLISSIPNGAYHAFIEAIELAQKQSGFIWSREIWDALDMEVGEFLSPPEQLYDFLYDENDMVRNTKNFSALLNAHVYTEARTAGLFTASPYLDTTWLLIIDIALHPNKWLSKKIDLSLLDHNDTYRIMYEFVIDNREKLANKKTPLEQVATIKSEWFGIKFKPETNMQFVKDNNPPRYIQIKEMNNDGEAIALSIIENNDFDPDFLNNITSKDAAIKIRQKVLIINTLRDIALSQSSLDNVQKNLLIFFIHDPYLINIVKNRDMDIFISLLQKIMDNGINLAKPQAIRCLASTINTLDELEKIFAINTMPGNRLLAWLIEHNKLARILDDTKFSSVYRFLSIDSEYIASIKNNLLESKPDFKELFSMINNNMDIIGDVKKNADLLDSYQRLYKEKYKFLDNDTFRTLATINTKFGGVALSIKVQSMIIASRIPTTLSREIHDLFLKNNGDDHDLASALLTLHNNDLLNADNIKALPCRAHHSPFFADTLVSLKKAGMYSDKARDLFSFLVPRHTKHNIETLLTHLDAIKSIETAFVELVNMGNFQPEDMDFILANQDPEMINAIVKTRRNEKDILSKLKNDLMTNSYSLSLFSKADKNLSITNAISNLEQYILGDRNIRFKKSDLNIYKKVAEDLKISLPELPLAYTEDFLHEAPSKGGKAL